MTRRKQIERQIAYAEGLRDGFCAAKDMVTKLSQGMLSLNKPDAVREWEDRAETLREERRALKRSAKSASTNDDTAET